MREWMVELREWMADPIEVNNYIPFSANKDERWFSGYRYR